MIYMSDSEARKSHPPLIFDNTMRTLFNSCQRKFYWWKIRGVDYLIRPSYFAWGSAWHLIKGYWYMSPGIKAEPMSPEWKDSATKALLMGLNYWDNSGAADVKLDTRANLQRLWKTYIKTYPNEPFEMVKGGAELGWLWPLEQAGGRPSKYFLGGSLDGYIKWEGFGLMALEEKTTGIWLSDFWISQWSFSSQVTGYIWFTKKMLGTEEVYGALINMATKQDIAACANAKTMQFARQLETRTDDDLKEFERDWRRTIESIERSWDRWHWPKTTDTINCTGGIGKSPCPYKGICLSGIEPENVDPLGFPNLTYRDEEWEPWKRDKQEKIRNVGGLMGGAGKPEVKTISPAFEALDKRDNLMKW